MDSIAALGSLHSFSARDASQLDADGGITAVLKSEVELNPEEGDHAVGVVIGGDSRWRATQLLEADFDR